MKKIKYSNLLVLGIFIYIIFNFFSSIIGKNIQTLVLENEKAEMKISRKCLIVRDEYLLKSNVDGKLNLLVEEGEKVTRSQEVANIYGDVDYNIDEKISDLNEEIEKIKKGEINISKDDISNFNKEIESTVSNIQLDLLNKDYSKIKEYKETLNKYVQDKNKLVNNGIDSAKLAVKEDEKKILENQKANNVATYESSISGIISYKYDGKEEKYNYNNLENITKSDIEKEKNEYKSVESNSDKIKEDSIILRVINNHNSYIYTYVDKNEKKYFEENESIVLRSGDNEIQATVYKVYEENDNFIAIFKINNQNIGIYDTRVEEFDIIYKQIEGIKIPKDAIKNIDGKEGVYVVSEENKTPSFVELKGVTYEDDEFKYIDYYKNQVNEIDTVDLYDKIILKPNFINTKMKIE
ncbi:hypothetical protein HF520_09935 [Romboutsia sp. CE17]|uniref:HlyD family efflux transporter periplasmic adaptor subunit n=1 Tax=Romboutsia sp. CE17 TaxID=2724150 RepID=UPI001442DD8C|nr:HlyD family efflux transporter periplasmic adaptor subunit [Romboutsia sp. CE17]QJA09256.1 hypothetical protein HF520_09935 [Romboutsia sp. CE17]